MPIASPRFGEAPVLETERLRLRGHLLKDFAACAALWGDPLVTRFIGGRPLSEEECWARLLRYVGHWRLLGFGFWVAEEKLTGSFVGELGFFEAKRALEPPAGVAPEAGWVFATQVQGRGYATESVRAIHEWADRHLYVPETTCLIHPENTPSLRVAAKCSYRERSRTTYHNEPAILLFRSARA